MQPCRLALLGGNLGGLALVPAGSSGSQGHRHGTWVPVL